MTLRTNYAISALFAAFLLPAASALAQQDPAPAIGATVGVVQAPQFFVSLLAGIILALGFQTILAVLSTAAGLSATPDLKEAYAKSRAKAAVRQDERERGVKFGENEDDDDEDEDFEKKRGSLMLKLTSAFGLWTLLTTSVALFLATWLAVKLSFVSALEIGLVLGLVIWAAFFMILTYLEIKTIGGVMGGMINLALTGVKGTIGTVRGILSPSPEKIVENASRKSVHAIYEEMSRIAHHDKLDRRLQDFLTSLRPPEPDYEQVKRDIAGLIENLKIEEKYDLQEDEVVRVLSMHLEKSGKVLNTENMAKLTKAVRHAAQEARSKARPADKVIAAAEALAPVPDEEAKQFRLKIEEYLTRSGVAELQPEVLRRDLEKIFEDPKDAPEIIRARIASLDRNALKALIAPRLGSDRADHLVESVAGILAKIGERVSSTPAPEGQQVTAGASLPAKIEQRLSAYFDSLHQPELNYDSLKHDIQDIMHDPAAAPRIIRNRLAMMDRDTVVAVLSSNSYISREQAQKIANSVIGARDELSGRVQALEDAALRRYHRIERRTVIAAEHARESAVAASWWTVGTALASGAAAAAGGVLATVI